MKFNNLRLSGFKSFVDKTEMPIMQGLTGIVGPNGCGKSNILDAIQWVMGENRPTSMRSGGMEDIIFGGAGTRPAKSFAEVVLTLDNSDFLAPDEFNGEKKIEIIRKVARDLGSNFKINGKEYRARDVQMLFADFSSGSQSNSIVKQGQVTELINAKPKDRRRILEEAAGISGLYQRRHEAELKLNNTSLNLSRISDIIEQLETQIKTLERQARQAKRYKELGSKIRHLESLLLYLKFKGANEFVVNADRDLAKITSSLAKSVVSVTSASSKRVNAENDIKPLRNNEARFYGELARYNAESSALEEQKRSAETSLKSIIENIERLRLNEAREKKLLEDASKEKIRLEEEKEKLEANVIDRHKENSLKEVLEAARIHLSNEESDLNEFGEKFARLKERLKAHEVNERQTGELKIKLKSELEELNLNHENNLKARNNFERSLEKNKGSLLGYDDELSKIAQDIKLNEKYKTGIIAKISRIKNEVSLLEGEHSFLDAEMKGLKNSIHERKKSIDQVADKLNLEDIYIKAVSSVLQEELEYPEIFSDEGSGWKKMDSQGKIPSLPEGSQSIAELIEFPDILKEKFSSVGLVKDELGFKMQNLLKMGQILVSTEGNLWRWDGFIRKNQALKTEAELNLERSNSLKKAEERLQVVKESLQKLGIEAGKLNEALDLAVQTEKNSKEKFFKLRSEIESTNLQISRETSALDMVDDKTKVISESILIKKKDLDSLDESEESNVVRQELVSNLEGVKHSYEEKKFKVEGIRLDYANKKTEFDQLNLKRVSQEKRIAEVQVEYKGWVDRLSEALDREKELKEMESNFEEEIAIAQKKPDELGKKKLALQKNIDEVKEKHKTVSHDLEKAENDLRICFDREKILEREVSDQREKRATFQANSNNAREKLRQLQFEISESLGLSSDDLSKKMLSELDEFPSINETEENIFSLKRKRESLGAVNLRADEDSSELLEKFSILKAEKDDLSEAIVKLSSGISDLNKTGRERLKNAFEDVNESFKSLFRNLFGGGEAMLTFVESSDPLEAGLEIFCQPPGKKLSAISLLSGGEQTLTALSLIFAVFMANPSPICILDEVDAPLDDSNTLKFCDLLWEMVKKTDTRFLVVTHNSITMSKMDRLLGVTMVEKGVSQLVSVSLQKAEAMVKE